MNRIWRSLEEEEWEHVRMYCIYSQTAQEQHPSTINDQREKKLHCCSNNHCMQCTAAAVLLFLPPPDERGPRDFRARLCFSVCILCVCTMWHIYFAYICVSWDTWTTTQTTRSIIITIIHIFNNMLSWIPVYIPTAQNTSHILHTHALSSRINQRAACMCTHDI